MTDLTLHPMKEIRIIIQGEHLKFATDLLDDKATGYTIVHNISGKGHHGFHTAHPMFNEMDSIVMLMTVVTADQVEPILAGLKPARFPQQPSRPIGAPLRSDRDHGHGPRDHGLSPERVETHGHRPVVLREAIRLQRAVPVVGELERLAIRHR
jgi:nitrogen regulatory protein PII